uniref:Uncharacterized protein n=1 Tax=Arundo donax TaxID=35708 RepID=A0A0A8XUP3_ARUDO
MSISRRKRDMIACHATCASHRFPLVGSFKRERLEDTGIRIQNYHAHEHTPKEIRKLCGARKPTSQEAVTQSHRC